MNFLKFSLITVPWIVLSILNLIFFKLDNINMTSLTMYYYTLLFLGFVFYPVLDEVFPKTIDRAYGLSKLLVLIFIFYINWILTTAGFISFSAPGISLSLLLTIVIIQLRAGKHVDLDVLFKNNFRHVLGVEALFLVIFCFYLVVNSYHPEIYWGEKPMDFTLLNFFSRATTLPPEDPWFAGQTMHYYYFGYYLFAGVLKMTGVQPEIGYPIIMATIPALMFSVAYSLLLTITKRFTLSLGGAATLVTASNWKAITGIFLENENLGINYFWNSTRVFANNHFAEYPSWSFLFGDLHPHVMSYPFVLLFLFFMYTFFTVFRTEKRPFYYLFFTLSWGILIAINSWDFIFYSLIFGFYLIYRFFLDKDKGKSFVQNMVPAGLLSMCAFMAYLPMIKILSTGKAMTFELHQDEHNTLSMFFNHEGHWWILILLIWVPLLIIRIKKRNLKGIYTSTFLSGLALSVFILMILAENFVFMDRVNTIFKAFNNVYILTGILAITTLRYFRFFSKQKRYLPFTISSVVMWSAVFLGTWFNIVSINRHAPFGKRKTTLHGSEYLNKMNPSDFEIINYIKSSVVGTPRIVEKYSRSFDHRGARISMHTGLPTYLGWDQHVYLRGAPVDAIIDRKNTIDFIYNSTDALKVHETLTKLNISFLIVGPLEILSYNRSSLNKFKQYSDLFVPLIKSEHSVLYGIGNYQSYIRGQQ